MDGPAGWQIADLLHLDPAQLEPVLTEETADWARELYWDYSHAADLVRGLLAARRIGGAALLDHDEVAGYGYIGLDGHKGLVADVYVRGAWRGVNAESTLLRVLFDRLIGLPAVTRIEAQLMLVDAAAAKSLECERGVHLFERALMTLDSGAFLPPGESPLRRDFRIEPWTDRHLHAAAEVITRAYQGHVDELIHDRYRTVAGAERFLQELIQFPGAVFNGPASWIAFETGREPAVGFSLAGFVAGGVGHIAELCVTPEGSGAGLGQALLARSLDALCQSGANRISLAVTLANERALRLYRRFGFREKRGFHAYVWERH